ncbi:MAG: Cof-type HAD-IIB family hydrolase [Acidobacteriota bacterium]|nr:Cof-type HAD-IIB family hydrolase [Acidobacteriota bacterium]
MPVKLLALDIDGTLLTPRGEITPRTSQAINEARQRGVFVVLVTGRRFGSARELVLRLELDIPLVSHNGALTKNIETLETVDFHPLDADTAREIIKIGRQQNVDMICCDDPHGMGTMVIEGISEKNRAMHRYLDKYRDAVVEVPDLLDYVQTAPIQMMFSGCCDPIDEFAETLAEAMGGPSSNSSGNKIQLFKTRYRSVDLSILDVLSTTASKGSSVAAVAKQHGIAREEIMAVGDNHNDLTMLRYAGLGVVMANAEDELKQIGFALTTSNEEDGVAQAIEKYILK